MSTLNSRAMRNLFDAVRVIHAHTQAPFIERLGKAVGLLFESTHFSFELYDTAGTPSVETDAPIPEKDRKALLERNIELVPIESPMFLAAADGARVPMRLSDFVSQRQLQRTQLYNDVLLGIQQRYFSQE